MAKTAQNKLTAKQDMFCREYLIDLNATQAAIRAGYQMSTPEKGRYYVYLLINPDTKKIFYVGKGIGSRMYLHEKLVRRGLVDNLEKCKEIHKIISCGKNVDAKCFAVCESEGDAYRTEALLISTFQKHGITNVSNGSTSSDDRARESARQLLSRFRTKSEYLEVFDKCLPDMLKRAVINVIGSAEKAYDMVYDGLSEIASL